MKKGDTFKNTKGEIVEILNVSEESKTVYVEFETGKRKTMAISTIKDKRRWTPVDYTAMVMQQKEDLGIECPKIDPEKVEMVPMPVNQKAAEEHIQQIEEDFCADGTSYADIGKEIAAQAKEKAKKASKKNLIEYKGQSLTLHGWSKKLGVPFGTLYARVTRFHWTYEEALSGKKKG